MDKDNSQAPSSLEERVATLEVQVQELMQIADIDMERLNSRLLDAIGQSLRA